MLSADPADETQIRVSDLGLRVSDFVFRISDFEFIFTDFFPVVDVFFGSVTMLCRGIIEGVQVGLVVLAFAVPGRLH